MIDLFKFVEGLRAVIEHDSLWVPLGVIVLAVGYFGFWFGRFFPRHPREPSSTTVNDRTVVAEYERKLAECSERLQQSLDQEKKYSRLNDALADESDLWRLHEPQPFVGYSVPINCSRPKIIMVANNKGGVGKTTLTAALAAYFEKRKGKRVLLIDLDYQGSLSGWMIRAAGIKIPPNQLFRLALANNLIDGTVLNHWQPEVLGGAEMTGDVLQQVQLITSDYTLTQHELKLMIRWLAQGGSPDVRYHIAQALLSDHVQNKERGFDVVLIDAPPRLSTSAIGALAAATHLLVPTKLDELSAETAGSFLKQVWELRARLNPGLELAGIVGTMTTARPLGKALGPTERDALGKVTSGLAQWRTTGWVFEMDIQDVAAIRKCAGIRNPYFFDNKVQEMFDRFGDELSARIGI